MTPLKALRKALLYHSKKAHGDSASWTILHTKGEILMSHKLPSSPIFAVNKSDIILYQNFVCWSFLLQSCSKKPQRVSVLFFLSLVFESQALSMSHSSFQSMSGDVFLHSGRLLVVWMQLQNFTFTLARCFPLKAVPLCVCPGLE